MLLVQNESPRQCCVFFDKMNLIQLRGGETGRKLWRVIQRKDELEEKNEMLNYVSDRERKDMVNEMQDMVRTWVLYGHNVGAHIVHKHGTPGQFCPLTSPLKLIQTRRL